MDTGQMMAVMQQMPAGTAAPQAGEAVVSAGQEEGAFAGLLQGMSQKKTAQTDPTEVKTDRPSLKDKTDPESQNVMLDMNGAQLAQLIAQLNGRMPEAVIAAGGQSEGTQTATQAGCSVTLPLDSVAVTQNIGNSTAQQGVTTSTASTTATNAGSEVFVRPDSTPVVPAQIPIMATVAVAKEQLLPTIAGNEIETSRRNGVAATGRDNNVLQRPVEVLRSADVVPLVPAEKGGLQTTVALQQVNTPVQVAAESQLLPNPLLTGRPEVVVTKTANQVTAPLQQPTPVMLDATGTENSVLQPEQPEIQARMKTPASTPTATATRPPQVVVQGNELVEMPASQPGATGQQEQQQTVRTAAPTTTFAAVAVTSAADRPDVAPVRLEQRETPKAQQGEQLDTAKTIAAARAGEQTAGSDENQTPDQGMNGNFQSHVFHQQAKTEGSPTVSSTSGTGQSETARTAPPPEQVVQQVRDRLVNHDTKPGSEQIVLRLSPEHLGELKVNLNLEGQRLKVEIVAENKMVRDSLMQHTDALKESLSRQNIKMESFDVTTGGNGSTDGGRGQGSWRELAQQRQQNTWMPEGGYRLAKEATPVMAAYQVKSEHTMVDLHF